MKRQVQKSHYLEFTRKRFCMKFITITHASMTQVHAYEDCKLLKKNWKDWYELEWCLFINNGDSFHSHTIMWYFHVFTRIILLYSCSYRLWILPSGQCTKLILTDQTVMQPLWRHLFTFNSIFTVHWIMHLAKNIFYTNLTIFLAQSFSIHNFSSLLSLSLSLSAPPSLSLWLLFYTSPFIALIASSGTGCPISWVLLAVLCLRMWWGGTTTTAFFWKFTK